MGQLKDFVDAAKTIEMLNTEIGKLKNELTKEKADSERKEQIIQAQAKTIQELGGYDNREEVLSSAE